MFFLPLSIKAQMFWEIFGLNFFLAIIVHIVFLVWRPWSHSKFVHLSIFLRIRQLECLISGTVCSLLTLFDCSIILLCPSAFPCILSWTPHSHSKIASPRLHVVLFKFSDVRSMDNNKNLWKICLLLTET